MEEEEEEEEKEEGGEGGGRKGKARKDKEEGEEKVDKSILKMIVHSTHHRCDEGMRHNDYVGRVSNS